MLQNVPTFVAYSLGNSLKVIQPVAIIITNHELCCRPKQLHGIGRQNEYHYMLPRRHHRTNYITFGLGKFQFSGYVSSHSSLRSGQYCHPRTEHFPAINLDTGPSISDYTTLFYACRHNGSSLLWLTPRVTTYILHVEAGGANLTHIKMSVVNPPSPSHHSDSML